MEMCLDVQVESPSLVKVWTDEEIMLMDAHELSPAALQAHQLIVASIPMSGPMVSIGCCVIVL